MHSSPDLRGFLPVRARFGRWLAFAVALPFWTSSVLVVASPARAQDGLGAGAGLEPALAVLELYVAGQDYAKTPEYVQRLSEELGGLATFSLLDRADADRQIHKVMTTSSRRITDERLQSIESKIKEGDELLLVKPRRAIQILAEAKTELKQIMETLTLSDKLRKDFFRTQMSLARAHHDNGNEAKAKEVIEEIIRVFGDDEKVTEEEYHPNIVGMYRETYRRLSEQRKGSLTVRTIPDGAEVFLNGKRQAQKTPATFEGLYPGKMTVATRVGGRDSMIHKVDIVADTPSEIAIDIDYETGLAFNEDQFGFRFATHEAIRARAADFATRVGQLLNVDYILLAGLVDTEGRTFLEGYLVNVAERKVERDLALLTKSNVVSNNRVTQLANFVAGREVDLTAGGEAAPWYENGVGWGLVGGGLAVAAAGIGLGVYGYTTLKDIAECDPNPPKSETGCKSQSDREGAGQQSKLFTAIGGVLDGVGAALVIGGAIAFILMDGADDDDGKAASAEPGKLQLQAVSPFVGAGGTAGVGAAFTF